MPTSRILVSDAPEWPARSTPQFPKHCRVRALTLGGMCDNVFIVCRWAGRELLWTRFPYAVSMHSRPVSLIVRLVNLRYRGVIERDRGEVEVLLRSGDVQDVQDGLLSAAYYDPEWHWVQTKCLAASRHSDFRVRWVAATCLGHLARVHGQLDLVPALERLAESKNDPLVKAGAEDALDDIRFYLKFQ